MKGKGVFGGGLLQCVLGRDLNGPWWPSGETTLGLAWENNHWIEVLRASRRKLSTLAQTWSAVHNGGIGGGGNGSREISTPVPAPSHNGTVNTGGGAGGGGTSAGGYTGGSGIVIIRYKFQ